MKSPLLSILAALSLAACSDAPTGPVTLTAADMKLLYQEIATTFSRADLARTAAPGHTPNGLSLDEMATIGLTVQCTGGGSANFSGTDTSTPTAPAYDASVTYSACATEHFEVSGNYHQTVVTQATATSSSITTTGSGTLTVKVLADGRDGTCAVDYTISVGSGGITATGTICGVAASGTLTA
ncbi:MAG TPA: hypothetical protein VGI83_02710 [Gemmatimonadales bacterium]|jgi:hypothetical protein